MITFKSTVRFKGLTPGLAFFIYALEEFHRAYPGAQPKDLVVTSVNDSKHSLNSKHYKNEAVDIRSKNFDTQEDKKVFREKLEHFLNNHPLLSYYTPKRTNKFRVLLESEYAENEHFHAQVKKGASFP